MLKKAIVDPNGKRRILADPHYQLCGSGPGQDEHPERVPRPALSGTGRFLPKPGAAPKFSTSTPRLGMQKKASILLMERLRFLGSICGNHPLSSFFWASGLDGMVENKRERDEKDMHPPKVRAGCVSLACCE